MNFPAGIHIQERWIDGHTCPACLARPGHSCQEEVLGRLRPVRPHLMTSEEVRIAESVRTRHPLLSEEP